MTKNQITNRKKSVRIALKGWIVLLIVALITIVIASVYRLNNKDKLYSELDNTKISEAGSIIDFDDYFRFTNRLPKEYFVEKPIRGIFLTANTAGIRDSLDNLINLANQTEINAFVIDVKNDDGHITYDMNIPLAEEIGSERLLIKDIDEVMDKLYDNNIYPIARIVAFKDPYLSSHKTDFAIKNSDGSLFKYKNISWISPYNKDSWKYIIDVAKEAALSGFKEIQFDYIRFEATRALEGANYGNNIDTSLSRIDVITDFVDYAMEELEPYNVVVSADVFGTIIGSEVDAKMIGQNYVEMAKRLDVICPMVYPSHYGRGYYGLSSAVSPDLYPYEIIYGSMMESNTVLEGGIPADQKKAIVRPWLQAFTASYLGSGNYMVYDGEAIRKQIQATYDAGLDEWILWHSGNRYSKDGIIGKR